MASTVRILSAARLRMLKDFVARPMALRLFVNEVPPGGEDDPDAFEEPEGFGYAPVGIHPENWQVDEGAILARYPEIIWTFRGPAGIIRGDFLTDGRAVHMVERFLIPFPAQHDGDQLRVDLVMGMADVGHGSGR